MENLGTIITNITEKDLPNLYKAIKEKEYLIATLEEYSKSYKKFLSKAAYENPGFLPTRLDVREIVKLLADRMDERAELMAEIVSNPDKAMLLLKDALRKKEEVILDEPITQNVVLYNFPKYCYKDIIAEGVKYVDKVIKIDGIITIASDTPVIEKTFMEYTHQKCGGKFYVILGDIPYKINKCPICRYKVGIEDLALGKYEEDQIFWIGIKDLKYDNRATPYTVLVMIKSKYIPYEVLKEIKLGARVTIEGIVRRSTVKTRNKTETTLFIEALNIDIKDIIEEIKVPKDKLKNITIDNIIESFAPEIKGENYIPVKKALLLSIVSGDLLGKGRIYIQQGKNIKPLKIRSQVHTLLAGIPGTGKTMLLQHASKLAVRSRYTNAIHATGVGLTVAVVKDPLGRSSLAGGAMMMAEGGVFCIDELDKLGKEQTAYLNEGMEYNTITVSKAGITATFPVHVSVIGAMNISKDATTIIDGIFEKLRPEVFDRFDLVFALIKENLADYKITENILSQKLLKAYLTLAKTRDVLITDEIASYITEAVKKIYEENVVSELAKNESVNRLRDKILRISAAIAKLKLKDRVDIEDVNEAIELKLESYKSLGLVVSGDIKYIEFIPRKSHMPKYMYELIKELEKDFPNGVPKSEIIYAAKNRFKINETYIEEILNILLADGKIYEANAFTYKTI